jgi:hypothetical protein
MNKFKCFNCAFVFFKMCTRKFYIFISRSVLHCCNIECSVHTLSRYIDYSVLSLLTGNGWTHLAIVYNASSRTLTLYLDCQKPKPQPVAGYTGAGTLGFHIPQDSLVYFRQEPGFKKKFLVCLHVDNS